MNIVPTPDAVGRLARFIGLTAYELFMPKPIALPVTVAKHFYDCFLAAGDDQQESLLRDAASLDEPTAEIIAQRIVAHCEVRFGSRSGELSTHEVARLLLKALRSAASASGSLNTPSDALRRSLNEEVLVDSGGRLDERSLPGPRKALGHLLTLHAVSGFSPAAEVESPDEMPTIHGYHTLSLLGRGGFASVYLARHESTGELRALKVGDLGDPRRVHRELSLFAELNDPNLVRYIEWGEVGRQYWIAMEYLGPYTLADLIADPEVRPSTEDCLEIANQVAAGLDTLHSHGLIHRDLKPQNVVIATSFRVCLIDFGLAKPFSDQHFALITTANASGTMGTPYYMSPEQVRGQQLTPRTDIWAFGILVYELLAGDVPFRAGSLLSLGSEIVSEDINLRDLQIGKEVRSVLAKCLSKDPRSRFPDGRSLLAELSTVRRKQQRSLGYKLLTTLSRSLLNLTFRGGRMLLSGFGLVCATGGFSAIQYFQGEIAWAIVGAVVMLLVLFGWCISLVDKFTLWSGYDHSYYGDRSNQVTVE